MKGFGKIGKRYILIVCRKLSHRILSCCSAIVAMVAAEADSVEDAEKGMDAVHKVLVEMLNEAKPYIKGEE